MDSQPFRIVRILPVKAIAVRDVAEIEDELLRARGHYDLVSEEMNKLAGHLCGLNDVKEKIAAKLLDLEEEHRLAKDRP